MYYRSLDSYLATPQPRIENNLIKRQTATISEREDELKRQIETKNIFYGGELNDRFDKLENNLMSLLDKKLALLETKIKLDDLKQDEKINMTDSEDEDYTDEESEDEDDTDEESEDENEKQLKSKQEKRKQYLKNYHQRYYLKNKAKNLKSKL